MLWRNVNTEALLLDMRTGQLHEVRLAYTKRGFGGAEGWVRRVTLYNLVTKSTLEWNYNVAQDIMPFAYVGR